MKLFFVDFMLLKVCVEYKDKVLSAKTIIGEPPKYGGLLNSTMQEMGALDGDIPTSHAHAFFVRGNSFFVNSCRKWRGIGMMGVPPSFHPTGSGIALVKSLGNDWKKYPVSVQIIDNAIDWSTAVYVEVI